MRGRSVIRKILRQCVVCRKIEGQHYSAPDPPPLPAFRVSENPPFNYIGVDFAGPLYINGGLRMRRAKLGSASTRAASFGRFVARKGLPERVISDNAKTFKGAAKTFKEIMNHQDVDLYLEGAKIQWVFNVEKAHWWGKVFERLIRSVKRCFKKVIGRARLTYDELLTIVLETELIVNCRQLICHLKISMKL
uniref:Integrase catalytic domain-containing protein n=1 Tax=Amphimedon queenslandica TaxID=400682 RepID=A0A1X7U6S4_AMPQE